jgi:phosphatidylglycerophosphate synthase
VLFAYLAYKLGVTPNQVTLTSCGLGCLSGLLAVFLSTDNAALSISILFVVAQLAYFLDCADGQLARTTNRASPFGAFLDHGLDILSFTVTFGGFFAYLYRYFEASGDHQFADLALLVGFCFLTAHASRFFGWETFNSLLNRECLEEKKTRDSSILTIAKSLLDHEFSLFTMMIFLLSPTLSLTIFVAQSVLTLMAYFRFFLRAYRLLYRED